MLEKGFEYEGRVYRSLMDFARMMGEFEKYKVSFVSMTQQFYTTHSMGRLTLNILLSFAQFERELVSERTRDKIAPAWQKGKYAGGRPVLGYDAVDTRLVVNEEEACRGNVFAPNVVDAARWLQWGRGC